MAARALAALSLAGLLVTAGGPAPAQESVEETNSLQGQVVTAYLEFRDVPYSYLPWSPPVTRRTAPFNKEPALGGRKVVRGVLDLGGGPTNALAFVWDRTGGKLHLDLNRNLDLTDDPGGVFSSDARGPYNQHFLGIRLPIRTQFGVCPTLLDVTLSDRGQLWCGLAQRSYWHGKVTLHDQEWQVALLRQPLGPEVSLESGELLLRSWADHARPFNQHDRTLEAIQFSRKLFFGNHAYLVSCATESSGGTNRIRLQFAEQQPKLGELRVAGTLVRRAILEGGAYRVVLDNPGPTVKVPVGTYARAKVYLQKGQTGAYLDDAGRTAVDRISVRENAPAVLAAGGALTNSVSVVKRGRNLSLLYQLHGFGGHYQLVYQDRAHPPEFTVFAGDKKIASGKFQYG